MASVVVVILLGVSHSALGDLAIKQRTMEAPTALWATISENKSEVKPLYASMAGDDPASGKNWSSKPKQQVNAWNRTMQHTYHTYIPESYQTLPSKAATIRASSAASNKEQKFKGYSEEYGGLAKVAMRGAKRDFHLRSHSGDGSSMPKLNEYADRYASKEHSHDTAYETYLKEYGGSEKGQDGEKYISGSGFAPSHDSEGANGWAEGSWNQKYEHSSGWKNQLSGVVPSFIPRFTSISAVETPYDTATTRQVAQLRVQDSFEQWCSVAAIALGGFALAAGVHLRRPRRVHPPESLLG